MLYCMSISLKATSSWLSWRLLSPTPRLPLPRCQKQLVMLGSPAIRSHSLGLGRAPLPPPLPGQLQCVYPTSTLLLPTLPYQSPPTCPPLIATTPSLCMPQLAAAGRALARAGPPGRVQDAYHILAGLRALSSAPLPRVVALALPHARFPASEAVRATAL